MKNKTQIIISVKFIKLSRFLILSGLTEYKLKQIKSAKSSEHDLVLVTAPDGNLFVNINTYQNWCVINQAETQIEFIPTGVTFITAQLYAELTGYSFKAIQRKIEDKIWNVRIAFRSPNGELMVNVSSVENWIIGKF